MEYWNNVFYYCANHLLTQRKDECNPNISFKNQMNSINLKKFITQTCRGLKKINLD